MVHVEVKEQECVCRFVYFRGNTKRNHTYRFCPLYCSNIKNFDLKLKNDTINLRVLRVYEIYYYIRFYRIYITINLDNQETC